MLQVPIKTEESEELRKMALRFFSFNEEFWALRTKKFMELATKAKEMRDDLDFLLTTMQNQEPFNHIEIKDTGYGYVYGSPVKEILTQINVWSMQNIFKEVLQQAEMRASWGKHSTRKIPHVEAIAWIAYFCIWEEKLERFVPGPRWVEYYNESYSRSQPK